MALFYHVRPMDLHAPSEYCNAYDCTAVVMKHEYDEAVRLLTWYLQQEDEHYRGPRIAPEIEQTRTFLRAAEGKTGG